MKMRIAVFLIAFGICMTLANRSTITFAQAQDDKMQNQDQKMSGDKDKMGSDKMGKKKSKKHKKDKMDKMDKMDEKGKMD